MKVRKVKINETTTEYHGLTDEFLQDKELMEGTLSKNYRRPAWTNYLSLM